MRLAVGAAGRHIPWRARIAQGRLQRTVSAVRSLLLQEQSMVSLGQQYWIHARPPSSTLVFSLVSLYLFSLLLLIMLLVCFCLFLKNDLLLFFPRDVTNGNSVVLDLRLYFSGRQLCNMSSPLNSILMCVGIHYTLTMHRRV